jgi:small-conductance mechanosensitive channel
MPAGRPTRRKAGTSRRPRGRGRGRAAGGGRAARGARTSLRRFRQASILALAVTGLIFLLLGLEEADLEAAAAEPAVPALQEPQVDPPPPEPVDTVPVEPAEVVEEALGQARETAAALRDAFFANLPRYLVVALILLVAWGLTRLLRPLLRWALRQWERAQAFTALAGVVIWLFALGVAVSVLVGDVRALVGSLGLIGLALSWALQNPIESFTGWLMNGMRGYYRVGDRIAVGEVVGDVFRIDFFTTTVWEVGGGDRGGVPVSAEQPTGRLITFPNNEVLTGSIVNFTRDFPWVWDELTVPVANESDLAFAMELLRDVAERVVGEAMEAPAEAYEEILRERRLESSVPRGPQVFLSLADSWAELTVRYLVHARERRVWKSRLAGEAMRVLGDPELADRIVPVYPRRQIMFIGPDGRPVRPDGPA